MKKKSICQLLDDGTKLWCNQMGDLHREDGPAVKCADGYKEWWVDGEQIECQNNEEFKRVMKLRAFW